MLEEQSMCGRMGQNYQGQVVLKVVESRDRDRAGISGRDVSKVYTEWGDKPQERF
jgi:hypothetical protein